MTTRLIGYDPSTGMRTVHAYDKGMRGIGYEKPNLEPLLDWTQYLRNTGIDDNNRNKQMRHVACVPDWVQLKWRNEEGIEFLNPEHWDRVKAKLNDPDWAYLRTGKGRI